MTPQIDLTKRVAIITGAGRGIGRAHALMMSSRGATVVVNDTGVEMDGSQPNVRVAQQVVDEIISTGGIATASTADVTTVEGGRELVDSTISRFGRVDILVHNAGIVRPGLFSDIPIEVVRELLAVHLLAVWHVGQPAWRQMVSQKYGRIVLTASGAYYGHPGATPYAAAKAAVIGVAKCLRDEAADAGLRDLLVNVVAPAGAGRMGRPLNSERFGELYDPSAVSAVVAFLVSDECKLSGEIFQAGGSHFANVFLGQTEGWAKRKPGLSPEEVREHFAECMERDRFIVPLNATNLMDSVFEFVVQQRR